MTEEEQSLPEESTAEVVEETKAETTPETKTPDDLEATNRQYAQEIDELKANLEMVRQRLPRETPAKPNEFGDLTDDDLPTVRDIKKAFSAYQSQSRDAIEEAQVAAQYPDYREVITSQLTKLLKEKPHLRGSIENAPNKALAAYELGKMYHQSQEARRTPKKASDEAARMIKNADKPGSLSQAGGKGTASQADYYASMSDNDFSDLMLKNLDSV